MTTMAATYDIVGGGTADYFAAAADARVDVALLARTRWEYRTEGSFRTRNSRRAAWSGTRATPPARTQQFYTSCHA